MVDVVIETSKQVSDGMSAERESNAKGWNVVRAENGGGALEVGDRGFVRKDAAPIEPATAEHLGECA
jgi:hypothetical protein